MRLIFVISRLKKTLLSIKYLIMTPKKIFTKSQLNRKHIWGRKLQCSFYSITGRCHRPAAKRSIYCWIHHERVMHSTLSDSSSNNSTDTSVPLIQENTSNAIIDKKEDIFEPRPVLNENNSIPTEEHPIEQPQNINIITTSSDEKETNTNQPSQQDENPAIENNTDFTSCVIC